MKDHQRDLTPDELREDLGAKVPGLEQLAAIPGVVPTAEEPVVSPGEERFERWFGSGAPRPVRRREFWLALLFFALLAAVPLRKGLFDADRVTFGLDQALQSEPWASALRAEHEPAKLAPQNDGLSDQAVNLYPFYRWVSRSYLAGDWPLWNPLIYCGAPGLGNPQAGVLDPQVGLLVAGEALGGVTGFHVALNWTAWLRLMIAGLGAYLLARRLGLGWRGAFMAGLTFQFSGYMVLWLNFPLGHVPPFLPLVLYFLEGLVARGTVSPWPARRAFVGAMVCMALAILGGHPETSFFIGVTAGVWCLALMAREARAGWLGLGALACGSLLASPALVAFWNYLRVSGAMAVRSAEQGRLEWNGLALLVLGGLVCAFLWGRRLWRAAWRALEPGAGGEKATARGGLVLLWGAGLVVATGGLLLLFGLGMGERVFLSLLHDYWGQPGRGAGFRGPGTGLLETGSTFLVTAAWLSAAAALISAPQALRRRGLIAGIACVAMGLALGLPGLVDSYRHLPLIGLGDTVRFAPVGALMIGLLAGEGLERAPRSARYLALVPVCAVLLALAYSQFQMPAFTPRAAQDSVVVQAAGLDATSGVQQVELTVRPGERLDARSERLEGWYVAALPIDRVRLVMTHSDPGEASQSLPLDPVARPEGMSQAPAAAVFFRSSTFQTSRLREGVWDLDLRFEVQRAPSTAPAGEPFQTLASVDLGNGLMLFDARVSKTSWVLLALVAGAFALGKRAVPVVLALSCAQGFVFSEGQNPTYDAALVFPETATERILDEQLGAHRFFSELGVMPPDTGLVRGLRALDGYDAIDPRSYSEMRSFALQPGKHPLLAWHAPGVDLLSPVFQMLGVKFLLFNGPMTAMPGHQGWELVACPRPESSGNPGSVAFAEVWMYRARDPFPRAWAVTAVGGLRAGMTAITQANAAWYPRRTALVSESAATWPFGLAPGEPAQVPGAARAVQIGEPVITNMHVTLDIECDGNAVLVLSEQFFAGARFEVDGAPRELFSVNGLFVGCELRAGDRRVVLYR